MLTTSGTGAPPGDEGLSLALLGHDLRAALAEMRAGLQLLNAHDLPDPLRGSLDRCRAVGDNLARLIDQSVMVCLGQGSPVTATPSDVGTAAFLAALRQCWNGRCAETGHRFELIEAGDLPACFRIDHTALDRVLANLVSNALTHAPPGPITVTFKISGGDLLLISVGDVGPGFPAAHLAAIQRDFALPPEARRPGGGFGLQSVRLLVQAMGGRCHARNKASGGAEVVLCLPIARPGATPPPLVPPPDLTGTTLLLADDSAASRELVGVLAQRIGASIHSVADGLAALQALQQGPLPDVLILDDEMPGATGLEILHWLHRSGGRYAALPVLALTSHIGAAEVAALRQAGAAEVLAKPVLGPLELGRAILRAQGRGSDLPQTQPAAPALQPLHRLAQLAGPAAAAELFQKLCEDLAAARLGLAQAARNADLGAIRAHSHVLIALAGTAGASAQHADAVALNSLAHAPEPTERLLELAARLDGGIGQLLAAVRHLAGSAGPEAGGLPGGARAP